MIVYLKRETDPKELYFINPDGQWQLLEKERFIKPMEFKDYKNESEIPNFSYTGFRECPICSGWSEV